jgi:hypothetical protein
LRVKNPPVRNWKVIWWTVPQEWLPTGALLNRHVIGQCFADRAWHVYWRMRETARGRAHIQGVELWRGNKRVL